MKRIRHTPHLAQLTEACSAFGGESDSAVIWAVV
jgi:hypothetical protein